MDKMSVDRGRTFRSLEDRADGASSLVNILFKGSIAEQWRSLLVMPTERSCRSAKENLAIGGGGVSGSILTPRKLAQRSYDLLGLDQPVIDLSGRELIVGSLMEKLDIPHLKVKGPVRVGMTRYISREIGDLIMGGVDHGVLLEGDGRQVDLSSIYSGYLERMDELDVIDPEQVPWKIVEAVDGGGELPWKRMGIYMIGPLPGSYTMMIRSIRDRMEEVHLVDNSCLSSSPSDPIYSIPERGARKRQMISSDVELPLLRSSSPWYEVESIARIVRSRIVKDGMDPSDITVVFPSRRRYDPLVKVLFKRYGLPLNMGNDIRLTDIAIVRTILDLLKCPMDGYRRDPILRALSYGYIEMRDKNGVKLDWRDLERFTRERFILGGGKEPIQDWVDGLLSISQDDDRSTRTKEKAHSWAYFISDLFSDLSRIAGMKRTVPERADEIVSFIDGRHLRDNDALTDLDRRAIDKFIVSLRATRRRSVLIHVGNVDHQTMVRMMVQEMEKEKLTTNRREGGVSILGLEGSVGTDHGLCIVGGCTSSMLPTRSGGFRSIGEKERIELGMQGQESRRDDLEALCMTLNSSREVILSHHTEDDGRPVMMSSFIEGLSTRKIMVDPGLLSMTDVMKRVGELSDPSFHLYDKKSMEVDPRMYDIGGLIGMLDDDDSERVRKGLSARGSRCSPGKNEYRGSILDERSVEYLKTRFGHDHVWSASRLEMYRQCPYSFFARYVLDLKEREDLEPGVPPERKGLIFHAIADEFYKEWTLRGRSKIKAAEIDQAWALMKEIAYGILASYPFTGPYWDALSDQLLGRDGEEGLLMEFLRVESGYNGRFGVDRTEMRFGPMAGDGSEPVEISLPGDEEGIDRFLLQGSIDRVDRMRTPHGDVLYIWDYKTGKNDVSEESIQVPLYLAALRKLQPDTFPGGGGYYYIRRKGSVRRDPVLGSSIWNADTVQKDQVQGEVDIIGNRISADITASLEMIDSIRCGELSPDPKCWSRWCPYVNICRRREVQ